jgi:hypothetical protein
MNAYELKQEAKKERYLDRAERAETKSTELCNESIKMTSVIPMGQPILVGHHSEKGHRSLLKRSDNKMRKSCEESDKAEYYKQKAESVGTGGISSDDPEALQKLKEKLNHLETQRDKMKAINKDFKQAKGDPSKMKLIPEDQRQEIIDQVEKAYSWCKQPYPSYTLTNLGANIRTVKKRIAILEVKSKQETTEIILNGVKVIDNVEENRLQLFFDGKPEEEVRTKLKSSGFRWARFSGCWQRHRSRQAIWLAKDILNSLTPKPEVTNDI